MIDQRLADMERLRPSGTLHLLGYPQKNGNRVGSRPVPLAFRVSAIAVFDDQIISSTKERAAPRALFSPAFARTPAARSFNPAGGGASVSLRPGADRAAFAHAASMLAARYRVGRIDIVNMTTNFAATERAIRPEAVALEIFAGLAGVIALAILAQLLSRQLLVDATEFPILRALGMTRPRLAALSIARAGAVTVAGGVLAVGVAIPASTLMPIGPARLAEPSPGIEINLAILAAGCALIAILPVILALPAIWRTAAGAQGPLGVAEPAAPVRAARLGPALGLAGSVAGSIGVRMAFEPGHGRTAVPVRSAMVGITVAVAAVVAAVVFGGTFIGLVSTEHRYGQNWSQELDLQVGAAPLDVVAKPLAKAPGLTTYAAGNYGQVSIGGTTVPAIGLDQLGGRSATDLGNGAAVTASVLSRPSPPDCAGPNTCYNFFLLRYQPGTDLPAAGARLERIITAAGCPPQLCMISTDQRPTDIQNYTGVRDTPLALCAVLTLLAVGTLAHVLLTGVRRRRRDLAVLKTLGLVRSQVLRVVSWQASALAATALAVGLPLGVAAGRWSWALFARSVGVASDGGFSSPIVLLVVPVTLLLANLIAAGPGWAAARVQPAAVLRTE